MTAMLFGLNTASSWFINSMIAPFVSGFKE